MEHSAPADPPPSLTMYYLPAIVFLAWALYAKVKLPDWRDARYVRNPARRVWGFWDIFDNREWTDEGLRLRRAYLRHILTGAVLAGLTAFGVSLARR
jgi:hypothetical protein